MINRFDKFTLIILILGIAGWLAPPVQTANLDTEAKLGDINDGSLSKAVHVIELFDADSARIRPENVPLLPFSTKQTCIPCHNYDKILTGWHFNANNPDIPAGRPGHPWILADRLSATQIPLSLRGWAGTLQPADVGLTPWYFVQQFGRQMPGGGIGENDSSDVDLLLHRWYISGKLEINCLACHESAAAHDQAEYATATRNQNFRWAAAATSELAHVTGSAKNMPDDYDIYRGVAQDDDRSAPPAVQYKTERFNAQGKVFMDLTREIPNDRCLFCHSTKSYGGGVERWETEKDVHLASGMQCVDCHRNGLDHAISRGDDEDSPFSCKGCHLGDNPTERGRLGAPHPAHTGIPTIHFEELACTACHAGPYPQKDVKLVQTAMAHGLGTHGIIKADTVAPFIHAPVYTKRSDGKIAPHNLLWPSFWGFMNGDTIQPLAPKSVQEIVLAFIQADTLTDTVNYAQINGGQWPTLSEAQVVNILDSLAAVNPEEGTPVFINNGKGYRKAASGLSSFPHKLAEAYTWPIAHNVRPAQQALGAKSCHDCHSLNAAFNFSKVRAATPIAGETGLVKSMVSLRGHLGIYSRLFAFTFFFRPLLKLFILGCVFILAATLVLFLFKGLDAIVTAQSTQKS